MRMPKTTNMHANLKQLRFGKNYRFSINIVGVLLKRHDSMSTSFQMRLNIPLPFNTRYFFLILFLCVLLLNFQFSIFCQIKRIDSLVNRISIKMFY